MMNEALLEFTEHKIDSIIRQLTALKETINDTKNCDVDELIKKTIERLDEKDESIDKIVDRLFEDK